MVELLLKKGANVNLSDKTENTPLHWASQNGSADVVQHLLNAHANPNCTNNKVKTNRVIDEFVSLFKAMKICSGFDTVTPQSHDRP